MTTTTKAFTSDDLNSGLRTDIAHLTRIEQSIKILEAGGKVDNLSLDNARRTVAALSACIANKRALRASLFGNPQQGDDQ